MEDKVDSDRPIDKRRCPAMITAGIDDPNSRKGIDFCIRCPYPNCVVFEDRRSRSIDRRNVRVDKAKSLKANGYSMRDIAKELGLKTVTIERYLKC